MIEPKIDEGTVLYLPKWADLNDEFIMQIHSRTNKGWDVTVYIGFEEFSDILQERQIRNLINNLNLNYYNNRE